MGPLQLFAQPLASGSLLGRFHPLAVHFPIALLLTIGLVEVVRWRTGKPVYAEMARFLIVLAAVSALGAMLLGFQAEGDFQHSGPQDRMKYIVWHEVLGIIATVAACVAAGFSERRYRADDDPGAIVIYRIALVVAIVAVCAAGFFGGVLVHGPNHLFG